jgi:hypothetical protein
MQSEQEAAGAPRRGVPTYIVEGVVAALVLVMGLTVLQGSRALGSGWTSDGPGSGYFPFYIGLIMSISAIGIFYQTVFGKKRNTEIFVDSQQLRQVLVVLIPAAIYVGAVQVIGLYVASAIYIALFMIYLGKFSPVKSVIAAVVVMTVFFLMFEVWFKVPLYKGMFDPLAFLGY